MEKAFCIGKKDAKIVIDNDGNTVCAKIFDGNKVVKEATVSCSPEDTFNFFIGADIAYKRLMGEKPEEWKPKYKVGDKVLIADKLEGFNETVEEMRCVCGKVCTIEKLDTFGIITKEFPQWRIDRKNIARLATTEEIEREKFRNCRVVCVKEYPIFTVGKIYTVKDFNPIDDDGDLRQFDIRKNQHCFLRIEE